MEFCANCGRRLVTERSACLACGAPTGRSRVSARDESALGSVASATASPALQPGVESDTLVTAAPLGEGSSQTCITCGQTLPPTTQIADLAGPTQINRS